jgi:hypothetical protein
MAYEFKNMELELFPNEAIAETADVKFEQNYSSTFADNMTLPVHKWYRYTPLRRENDAYGLCAMASRDPELCPMSREPHLFRPLRCILAPETVHLPAALQSNY